MGPQEEYIETVVTCDGDFYDPGFRSHLEDFSQKLEDLIVTDQKRKLILKKVEPWNSVRVTFKIPAEAALRLRQMAERGDPVLKQLGILAVQIDGDHAISLKVAGRGQKTTEVVIKTHPQTATSGFEVSSSEESASTIPSNVEATRKNIVHYLSQGPYFQALLNKISSASDVDVTPSLPVQNDASITGHSDELPLATDRSKSNALLSGAFPEQNIGVSVASSTLTVVPSTSFVSSVVDPKFPPTPPPSTASLKPNDNPGPPFDLLSNVMSMNPGSLSNEDVTSTSPLLVNLLQGDAAGAHLHNLMQEDPELINLARQKLGLGQNAFSGIEGFPSTEKKVKKRKNRKTKDPTKKKKVPTATLR